MVNVYLIGFMGTGKSTIGESLAKKIQYDFVDSDHKIEETVGTDIPDIFYTYGEEYFRRMEYEVINNLIDRHGMVVSTGGGSVMNNQLFDLLLCSGIVIHLDASLEVLYDRLKVSNNRPMLYHDNPKQRIDELYSLRHPIYMRAHHTIKTDGKDENQIRDEIIEIIKRRDNK